MKRQHLTPAEIEAYSNQTLAGNELLSIDDHCRECQECRQQLIAASEVQVDYAVLRQDLRLAEKTDHLSFEQMQSHVDEKISEIDREIVESHLESCESCAAELKDLQLFKARMKPEEVAPEKDGRVLFFSGRFPSTALRIAGIAAGLVLVTFAATIPFRNRIAHLESDLQQARLEKKQMQHQLEELQKPSKTPVNMASLRDGGAIVELGTDQHLKGMDSVPPSYRPMIQEAFVTGQLQTPPFLGKIIPEGGTLMGGNDTGVPFGLLQPVGIAVLSDRPAFRWNPVSGAKGYKVGISDTSFNEVESSGVLRDTSWVPTRALSRGAIYIWQVTAFVGGTEIKSPVPPAPEARFKVLETGPFTELSKAQQSLRKFHLLMGILYSKYGVLDEAESEFQELLKANPDSTVAAALLLDVQKLRKKHHEPAPTSTNGAQ